MRWLRKVRKVRKEKCRNEIVEKGENGKNVEKKCMTWLRKLRKEKITE
jgi:hypothetical protein